jgi:putative nucleotidyltransferase with HDIG domain
LTRLHVFVLASALLLALGAVVLGSILAAALRGQALDDAKTSLTQYTSSVLSRSLVHEGRIEVSKEAEQLIDGQLRARPDILTIKVWRPDGVLAWTNRNRERIGRQFELGSGLEEALESGEAEAAFEDLGEAEDAVEAGLGVEHVLEVYAPVVSAGGTVGAYEIYADSSQLEGFLAERKRLIWLATGAVFVALWGLLLLLVREASRTLRQQTTTLRQRSRDLLDSYRRLEESSLEAIESLNATVEAKDPYTAGHSARVQRVAVAIGEELDLPPDRLDALRVGSLFHDIGKLAVPDAILTKPSPLSPEEFELIKRHSDEGAHIVGKLGRLREAVPLIRHHHERWSGGGYPDGISEEAIPLGACIVALADAWDAMTTDRPYHRALTVEEATGELRTGRGTQFAPDVVDAFFRCLRRRPAELGLEGDRSVAQAS